MAAIMGRQANGQDDRTFDDEDERPLKGKGDMARFPLRCCTLAIGIILVQLLVTLGIVLANQQQSARMAADLKNVTAQMAALQSSIHGVHRNLTTLSRLEDKHSRLIFRGQAHIAQALNVKNFRNDHTLTSEFNEEAAEIFENMAQQGLFTEGEQLEATVTVRKCLDTWLAKYNIQKLVDCPCGEGIWQGMVPRVANKITQYYGYDISQTALDRAIENNKDNRAMKFAKWDISTSVPLKGGIFLMRDALQYWPLDFALDALRNAKATGSKYLAVSTFPLSPTNRDISFGEESRNNVLHAPFLFPGPLEDCINHDGPLATDGSRLQLFDLQAITLADGP